MDLADPGCLDSNDLSEHDPTLRCDEGADNDNDGRVDFDPVTKADPGDENTSPAGQGDPGCLNPHWTERPPCQDRVNNDFEAGIDFDGGASDWGITEVGIGPLTP
jgi:hypothetical protein